MQFSSGAIFRTPFRTYIYLFIKTKVIIVFILLKETFVEIIFENLKLSKMLVKGAAVDIYFARSKFSGSLVDKKNFSMI